MERECERDDVAGAGAAHLACPTHRLEKLGWEARLVECAHGRRRLAASLVLYLHVVQPAIFCNAQRLLPSTARCCLGCSGDRVSRACLHKGSQVMPRALTSYQSASGEQPKLPVSAWRRRVCCDKGRRQKWCCCCCATAVTTHSATHAGPALTAAAVAMDRSNGPTERCTPSLILCMLSNLPNQRWLQQVDVLACACSCPGSLSSEHARLAAVEQAGAKEARPASGMGCKVGISTRAVDLGDHRPQPCQRARDVHVHSHHVEVAVPADRAGCATGAWRPGPRQPLKADTTKATCCL